MWKKTDKVILEMAVLLCAGIGLYAVITKSYVQGINAPLYGVDILAIKKEVIDKFNSYIFLGLALVGLAIQLAIILAGEKIKKSLYSFPVYFIIFLSGVAIFSFLTAGLVWTGAKLARRVWLPQVVEQERGIYLYTKRLIANKGVRDDQRQITDPRLQFKLKCVNFDIAGKYLRQMDETLELDEGSGDFTSRIRRLAVYFE